LILKIKILAKQRKCEKFRGCYWHHFSKQDNVSFNKNNILHYLLTWGMQKEEKEL
jgi:hypothetical protein